jgi:carbonic anhydrase
VRAAIDATEGKLGAKGQFIQHIVAAIQPTVTHANSIGRGDIDSVTELHIQDTIQDIQTRSKVIADAVSEGRLAIVGANYELSGGEVHPITVVGAV